MCCTFMFIKEIINVSILLLMWFMLLFLLYLMLMMLNDALCRTWILIRSIDHFNGSQ